MERSRDWWVQAQADLRHARHALEDGDFDWACFAAQQAAEKAVKAVFQRRHLEARGHVISILLKNLPSGIVVPEDVLDAARLLDKFYIPTRYPNSLEQGAPTEFYTRREAEEAIERAQSVLAFCADHLG
ncbi:MAG: HEPN domain-containing protein [bacterium]